MTPVSLAPPHRVAIVGGGPAGLMAADVLSAAGASVDLFDAMPSVGRKFLLAGKGGLNLTHAEGLEEFAARYGPRRGVIEPLLRGFGPDAVRNWSRGLGVDTFVGSSGRVFPTDLKAAPLLRAWLHRLRSAGVRFHMRHRWLGWVEDDAARGVIRLAAPNREATLACDALVLALGGASWSRLGSDGGWVPALAGQGVDVAPLKPSNCGFDAGFVDPASGGVRAGWSEHFRLRFAGHPVKNVALALAPGFAQAGEFVITDTGVEGSLIYAASAFLRDHIEAFGHATPTIDLLPGRDAGFVRSEVARPRGSRSLSTHLKSRLGLDGARAGLLRELLPAAALADPALLGNAIKALPLTLIAPRPIDEAISTAGGVRFEVLDPALMLRRFPGVFCAGEMLDWEAPTGGYLLTACLASGSAAGSGVLRWLAAARGATHPERG